MTFQNNPDSSPVSGMNAPNVQTPSSDNKERRQNVEGNHNKNDFQKMVSKEDNDLALEELPEDENDAVEAVPKKDPEDIHDLEKEKILKSLVDGTDVPPTAIAEQSARDVPKIIKKAKKDPKLQKMTEINMSEKTGVKLSKQALGKGQSPNMLNKVAPKVNTQGIDPKATNTKIDAESLLIDTKPTTANVENAKTRNMQSSKASLSSKDSKVQMTPIETETKSASEQMIKMGSGKNQDITMGPMTKEDTKLANKTAPKADTSNVILQDNTRDTSKVAADHNYSKKDTLTEHDPRTESAVQKNLTKAERQTLDPINPLTMQKSKNNKTVDRPADQINTQNNSVPSHSNLAQSIAGPVMGADGMQVTGRPEMQDLISRLSSQMQVMEANGESKTMLTLKNSTVFDGATLTLKAFDSAKGEFNISFANLSNKAKALLDQVENRDALKLSLENKGYIVHIMTATTEQETLIAHESQAKSSHQKEEGDKREQEREKQGKEKEAEKEDS